MNEPVVARVGCAGAALADVLIAEQGCGCAAQRCTEILRRYPGAAVVLVLGPAGVVALGFRDGGTLTSSVEALRGWAVERVEPGADGRRTP